MKDKISRSKIFSYFSILPLFLTSQVHAELPAGASTAIANLTSFHEDMSTAGWTLLGLTTVLFMGMRMFKKTTSKAV